MIRSMTGFGRAEYKSALGLISVEIKSLNHRFLDISCKLPADFATLEERIKEYIQQHVKRGKIYVSISLDNQSQKEQLINIDEQALLRGYRLLSQIKKKLQLKDPIRIDHLLSFNGIICYEKPIANIEYYWPRIKAVVHQALKKLIRSRTSEGQIISRNLRQHMNLISQHLKLIQERVPEVTKTYRKQLEEKIKQIGLDLSLMQEKIMAEVAVFLQRSDITEEINRIKGHISLVKRTIATEEAVGRKLDFICQELHREINTIGVKAPDLKISEEVVNIKVEIEKIKEQIQNVE